jgi:hypothetical protein
VRGGDLVNERPESDALHHPPDVDTGQA